jgi:LmbE family N-acetylglucosaminyl deacetylase
MVKSPFNPTIFEDVTKQMTYKIKAFKFYKSEVEKFPHPRSLKAIENLAIFRGTQSGLHRAEAFQLIRSISK